MQELFNLCNIMSNLNILNLKVGCGAIKFPERSLTKVIVVCQYTPHPNINSQNVFEIGDPCSGCTSDCIEFALCGTAEGNIYTT